MKKIIATLFSLLRFSNANAKVNLAKTPNLDIPDWSKMSIEEIYQMRRASKTLEGFGFKTSWYAISEDELKRTHLTIQDLANQLHMQQQEHLSWNEGFVWISKNYGNQLNCFITPNLHGWIYVVCGVSDKLDLLDGKFDNFYGFTSYRVVGAVAWKVVKNSKIERYFTFADGQLYDNEGKQTKEEQQLGLAQLDNLNEEQAINKMSDHYDLHHEEPNYIDTIDEETPAKLNEILTGQNPLKFDEIPVDEVRDTGIVGFLPK